MSESIPYRLGRLYGRLSPPGRLAVLAAFGIGVVWLLLPSDQPPGRQITPNASTVTTRPAYDPVAKWGQSKVDAALAAWAAAQKDAAIYEEGSHLVVEMKFFMASPSERLEYVRAIADTDVILQGKPRTIFFYDPSRRKIAQADSLNGVRLVD